MSDLKTIKNHKKVSSVVGLQCQGTKCSQRSHNEAHSKTHFLYWSSPSVCRMPFSGTKPQRNGKKLDPPPWQCVFTNCPCSAADFGTELQRCPNYLFHQISLRAISVTSQGPRPDSKVIILHLQKKFNRILQHVSQPYQKMTSRDTSSDGRTAGASCMRRSEVLPGWLSCVLYTSILVWIMTTFQELSDLPT